MSNYVNPTGVSLPIAVWLATNEYDGKNSNPYQISATSLLKSVRQTILGMRIKPEDEKIDVAALLKARIGNAIHSAIENAWTNKDRVIKTLKSLGYSDSVAQKIEINPTVLTEGSIPVYMEQRKYKKIGKWTVTGKFDFIFGGRLRDFKSTSTFTYVKGVKDGDYIKQGSIYRWFNPTKVTDPTMEIDFIFLDWKEGLTTDPNYPPSQVFNKTFPLMPIAETEAWVESRLKLLEENEFKPESELPLCNDEELWRGESVWKYYKSGQVTARSTKNFSEADGGATAAYARKNADGGTGLVIEQKSQPTACKFCNAASLCKQKDMFIASGELIL